MANVSPYAKKRNVPAAPSQDDYGNIQPQALELEQAVLGAILIEQEAYDRISDTLEPEHFYEKRHQRIYEAARSLSLKQAPIDLMTMRSEMDRLGTLEEVGGLSYLSQLAANMTSSAHIEYHASIVSEKYLGRQLITYSSELIRKAFDPTHDVNMVMQEAEGRLFELSQKNLKKDYTQINPVIHEAYELIHKAAAQSSGISGTPSGFHLLDRITSGWQNSDLVILAARPAMGKTAFALSMAKNIAVEQQLPMAFFSLEMSNVQLVNRLIVNVCGIEGSKVRSGQLAPYEWAQLDHKIKELFNAPLYVDDTPSLSIFDLRTKARRLVKEHHIKLIMIDYLQLMNASGMSFSSRQEEVSTISRSLKGLARELNIPILALSQLNRGVEGRVGAEGKRPQLSDLRESGAIEQDADMVLFIHRPEYYRIFEENGKDLRGKAEIIIAKHRNGSVGDVLLNFKGKYVRFENLEDETSVPLPDGENPFVQGSRINQQTSSTQPEAQSPFPELPTNMPDDVPF